MGKGSQAGASSSLPPPLPLPLKLKWGIDAEQQRVQKEVLTESKEPSKPFC